MDTVKEREIMNSTLTLTDFITSAGITMKAERTDHNPTMDDSANMDHWKVTLRAGRSRMSLVFSMGYGHKGEPPTLSDVLDCLASDASSFDNAQSFEDWADDYGYDVDSRKAEKTYKAVQRSAERLQKFLGESAYNTLLSAERE
jgi:hypothetical protein